MFCLIFLACQIVAPGPCQLLGNMSAGCCAVNGVKWYMLPEDIKLQMDIGQLWVFI